MAACAQLTAQAVADAFDADVSIGTEVSGDLDPRGTMEIDRDVPVGFEEIRLDVTVDGEIDEETAASLYEYTERYCVVYRTLVEPPELETAWRFERGEGD